MEKIKIIRSAFEKIEEAVEKAEPTKVFESVAKSQEKVKKITRKAYQTNPTNEEKNQLIYNSFSPSYWNMPSTSEDWQSKYAEFLLTDRWIELRSSCLDRFGGECAICDNKAITAHHRHYNFGRFGTEDMDVLTAVCKSCHHRLHNPYASLDEVRKEADEAAKTTTKGTSCPICSRPIRKYKRKFSSAIASFLIVLVNNIGSDPWFDANEVDANRYGVMKGGDYAKAEKWGLAEQRPKINGVSKKGESMWRPTELGVSFVNGLVVIPKHAYVYKNKVLSFTEEMIDIKEALGNKFDYEEMMNS